MNSEFQLLDQVVPVRNMLLVDVDDGIDIRKHLEQDELIDRRERLQNFGFFFFSFVLSSLYL